MSIFFFLLYLFLLALFMKQNPITKVQSVATLVLRATLDFSKANNSKLEIKKEEVEEKEDKAGGKNKEFDMTLSGQQGGEITWYLKHLRHSENVNIVYGSSDKCLNIVFCSELYKKRTRSFEGYHVDTM